MLIKTFSVQRRLLGRGRKERQEKWRLWNYYSRNYLVFYFIFLPAFSALQEGARKSHKSTDYDKVIFITIKWSRKYIYDFRGWNWIKRHRAMPGSMRHFSTPKLPSSRCDEMSTKKFNTMRMKGKEWSECTKINRAHERNFRKGEDDSTENTTNIKPRFPETL